MLAVKPGYFEEIRSKAANRWDQLERDPELAGPWHQLFRQVQSPRHVLSELLQNADDAFATEAKVRIENGVFSFEHNGEDFSDEHFASLCRFGYSSKRSLHTIGFRGIGFKSTFSLGDCVELATPSLSVDFLRKRFTEPCWSPAGTRQDGKTCISVAISDQHRQHELERNLEEWLSSPVSLLFFRNLRRIEINGHAINWGSLGPGPVECSEWMGMHGSEDKPVLIVRSEAVPFPEEALAEIREERTLSADEQADFPASKVELVLGVEGRLFVVLPTGVKTQLPFACNAPFIAKPDRNDIKDPAISATNRWLLERAGKLAASVMTAWLAQKETKIIERVAAYGLLPDVDRKDSSLGGICGTIVEETFADAVGEQAILLTETGDVVLAGEGIIIPDIVLDIWSAQQAAEFLDDDHRPILAHDIATQDKEKLVRWNFVEKVDKKALLDVLRRRHLPKPESWRKLLTLWAYVAPEVAGYYFSAPDALRIVPVQGQDVLYAANEVVRLGEKKLLQSDSDWQFLSGHLTAVNQNWVRYLADQRRQSESGGAEELKKHTAGAYAVLKKIGLDDTSNADAVINRVAAEFFAQKQVTLADCVRLAQIAARLGASAGDAFRFVSRGRTIHPLTSPLYFDEDGWLQELIPENQWDAVILHGDYTEKFESCSEEDWLRWVSHGNARLLTFIPLTQTRKTIYGRQNVQQEAAKRGYKGDITYHYKTSSFVVEDWDFKESFWLHWEAAEKGDPGIWGRIVERLLIQRESYWSSAKSARLKQVATTGTERSIIYEDLEPNWARRLGERACLPDTHNMHRKPAELLRRTPETESLLDIEPFVNALLDREASRPVMDLLGVRHQPHGPASLLDRLRVYAQVQKAPIADVEKCYRRLDQMVGTCTTADFQEIKKALSQERLILSEGATWETIDSIFLLSDEEDVPAAAVIRSALTDLALWSRLGVQRPTAELAIDWLQGLPSGQQLSADDGRRVRALLARYPQRIWEECGHWLNLAGEWVPADTLSYSITMQSLVPWTNLHPWVKQQTADMIKLPAATTNELPFSAVPSLSAHIEEQFHKQPQQPAKPVIKEWIAVLGSELSRAVFDSESDGQRLAALAKRLAVTAWQSAPALEIIPYLKGVPAGLPRRADVLWLDNVLYVDELPKARLARRVPEEIARQFGRADIRAALDYSFERPASDVREYLAENFNLSAPAADETGEVQLTSDGFSPEDATSSVEEPEGLTERPIDELEPFVPEAASTSNSDDIEDEPDPVARPQNSFVHAHSVPKPRKLEIMERFAKSQGYKKDGEDRFFHPNGGWITRAHDSRFPWESRSASGDIQRYYWPKDHCLEQEPLQLEADVWSLIDQYPSTYALVLSDSEGNPTEVSGGRLRALLEQGGLTLHPATYRIVYNHDQSS
ncbi:MULTISPECIES: ATPase [unclassified Mesorhizobium]|uniref:sacsin N-terminal ATP-binding-like domain-containing protein n=1 Tax=unclassified Mesorhizobium TaxID=325217 RepID=UPI001092F0AF|nr:MULTISPECIES: ATPase [unclassified Mesorhizobium]TGP85629.1 ATPase [Mesorhizobium sp. M8A.F.Ca.ET.218.01.1.1]TGT14780.1 ATPase [Mesorhizobium sp. M8A.F.Ca.ET.213.01.1.1]